MKRQIDFITQISGYVLQNFFLSILRKCSRKIWINISNNLLFFNVLPVKVLVVYIFRYILQKKRVLCLGSGFSGSKIVSLYKLFFTLNKFMVKKIFASKIRPKPRHNPYLSHYYEPYHMVHMFFMGNPNHRKSQTREF